MPFFQWYRKLFFAMFEASQHNAKILQSLHSSDDQPTRPRPFKGNYNKKFTIL